MYRIVFFTILFILSSFSKLVFAFESTAIPASVVITQTNTNNSSSTQTVYLMKLHFTTEQEKNFLRNQPAISLQAEPLPRKINLGMNNVPVLNQGQHASCVTFATTAALDVLLDKGDYVSQLCNLELGSYLQEKGYLPSGWDDSKAPFVLHQIQQFGIINKSNQKLKSCAGVMEYPLNNPKDIGATMSLDQFQAMSESMYPKIDWFSLLTFSQRMDTAHYDGNKLLMRVKQEMVKADKDAENGMRILFAVALHTAVPHCSAGACATYHAKNDTWANTRAISQDKGPIGGHEMIITGYDDDALAIDNEGKQHYGLLFLRNSWGDNVGDHGDYYMTYDFFRKWVMDVNEISIQ